MYTEAEAESPLAFREIRARAFPTMLFWRSPEAGDLLVRDSEGAHAPRLVGLHLLQHQGEPKQRAPGEPPLACSQSPATRVDP